MIELTSIGEQGVDEKVVKEEKNDEVPPSSSADQRRCKTYLLVVDEIARDEERAEGNGGGEIGGDPMGAKYGV